MTEEAAKYLDGDTLAAALRSGIHRVLGEQELLNRINVFPVADSDTGTNMALSLGAALAILNQPGEKHLGTMLAGIADALLDGSRGNSGAIVAQFFQGVSDAAGEITRFTTYTFGKAIEIKEGPYAGVSGELPDERAADAAGRADHDGGSGCAKAGEMIHERRWHVPVPPV